MGAIGGYYGGKLAYSGKEVHFLSHSDYRFVKEKGLDNNLLELIAEDKMFGVGLEDLKENLIPAKYTGCAAHQVERRRIGNYVLDVRKA